MLGVQGSDLHWILPEWRWAANSSFPNSFNILASECHCSPFVKVSVVPKVALTLRYLALLFWMNQSRLAKPFWVLLATWCCASASGSCFKAAWCLAHILPLSFWLMFSFKAKAASSAVSVSSAIFSTFSCRLSFPRPFKFFLVSLPFGKVVFLPFDKVAFLPSDKVALLPFGKEPLLEEAAAFWPFDKVALPFAKAFFNKGFFTFMFFWCHRDFLLTTVWGNQNLLTRSNFEQNLEIQSCRHYFVWKIFDKRLEETLLKRFYLAIPNLRFSKRVSKVRNPKNFGPTLMDFVKHLWGSYKKIILVQENCIWWEKNSGEKSKKWNLMKIDEIWWNLMKIDEIWWNLMKWCFHQISSSFIKFHFFGFFSPDFSHQFFFQIFWIYFTTGIFLSIGPGCLLSRQPSLYLPTKQNQTPISQVLVTKTILLTSFFWRWLPTKFAPMLWEALSFLRYYYSPLPFVKAGPTKNASTAVVSPQSFFFTPTAFH